MMKATTRPQASRASRSFCLEQQSVCSPRLSADFRHLASSLPLERVSRGVALLAAAAAFALVTSVAGDAAAQGAGKTSDNASDKTSEAPRTADDAKTAEEQKQIDAAKATNPNASPSTVAPPHEEWRITDVEEIPTKRYLFIGARYRGNVIPKFMLNLFVDEGATIYSNSVGLELDMRKDGFSFIPALSFAEYGTGGDVLFKSKDGRNIAGNYSVVNSSLKALYATVDLLWSAKLSKSIDFEYGAGIGLGVVFGDLVNNWVYRDANGQFVRCQSVDPQKTGCNPSEHQGATKAKVGNYSEPSWANGGSKPLLFPWLSIPQVGLRFKPVKNFVGRLGMGLSLTGFWFGLSGSYGLEQKPKSQ